ncbi:MAG: hypothetical protein V1856_01730 [Candidatus Liptonbacteria bacterium]
MGEVIRGFFGQEEEEEVKKERVGKQSKNTKIPGTKQELRENNIIADRARRAALDILDYLLTLKYSPSREVLATASKSWRNLTDMELIEAAEESTPFDWKQKPGTFEALVREIDRRFPEE